jgi:hypothetical protein
MIKNGVFASVLVMHISLFGMIASPVPGANGRLNGYLAYLKQQEVLYKQDKENKGLHPVSILLGELVERQLILHALYDDPTVARADVQKVDDAYSTFLAALEADQTKFLEVFAAQQRLLAVDQRAAEARQLKLRLHRRTESTKF